jgi:hypothetical protein
MAASLQYGPPPQFAQLPDASTRNYLASPCHVDLRYAPITATAKILDEHSGPSLIGSKQTVVDIYTPGYRWPFDILTKQGKEERRFQHTWDLVSWAVIAVEMIANINVGSPAEALEVLKEKISQDIEPEIRKLLEQALSKNPEKRPQEIDKFCTQIVNLTERRKKRLKWEN